MFIIGFVTNVHWEVMIGLTQYLYSVYGCIESFLTFKLIIYGFLVLATIQNARGMLTIEHLGRFEVAKHLFVCSYLFFIVAFIFSQYEFCMNVAAMGMVILTFATIYGQLTVLGYFKCIPQELIVWYMIGSSASSIIGLVAEEAPHTQYGQKLFAPFFLFYFLLDLNFQSFKWIEL